MFEIMARQKLRTIFIVSADTPQQIPAIEDDLTDVAAIMCEQITVERCAMDLLRVRAAEDFESVLRETDGVAMVYKTPFAQPQPAPPKSACARFFQYLFG